MLFHYILFNVLIALTLATGCLAYITVPKGKEKNMVTGVTVLLAVLTVMQYLVIVFSGNVCS